MKIAGRKNDGAWFRTLVQLQKLSADEKSALAVKIAAIPTLGAYLNDLNALREDVGLPAMPELAAPQAFAENMVEFGIPRQVWMGQPTFGTYTKVGDKYVMVQAEGAKQFAYDLRKLFKLFFFGRRQLKDVQNKVHANEGNPGGIADADPAG